MHTSSTQYNLSEVVLSSKISRPEFCDPARQSRHDALLARLRCLVRVHLGLHHADRLARSFLLVRHRRDRLLAQPRQHLRIVGPLLARARKLV